MRFAKPLVVIVVCVVVVFAAHRILRRSEPQARSRGGGETTVVAHPVGTRSFADRTEAIGTALASVHFDFTTAEGLKNTVLINNAGVLAPIAPIGDCDDTLLDRNIRINLTAPLVLARHFYRFSRSFQGRKWIVNITSGASQAPYYGWSAYGAAKAGLDMASRAMALEFSGIDPTFNACAVAPGTVDTDMQAQIRDCTPQQFERVAKFIDLKANDALYSPQRTAAALIRLLLQERFENGGRYDLRELET